MCCIGCTYIAQHCIRFSMRFTSIFSGYRTCLFRYQLNSLGSIQPCCHHSAGNYSNTQAITVQPRTHSLLGRESLHTGEVSCPRTQHHTTAAETHPQDLSSPMLQIIVTAPWRPACIWSIYFRCTGTLRVVTARELLILGGSFTSQSMLVRWLHHLHGHTSHKRHTVSGIEGQEINLHKPLPRMTGIEPGATAWHTTTCTIATFLGCLGSENVGAGHYKSWGRHVRVGNLNVP